ncbi:hypothetical protein NUZ5A_20198 [Candidatus Nitrosotenuis uzonensis]|uniref:Holin n=1 Tax=Candidatus Nitrosotenuis uzonensis TaxID=1407055 RepID=A0A812EU82_9ARCH|nr:hypothetical protein NUZ5A_20198 [Candidatus Nitrosotenuis uzonensis]
MSRFAGKKVDNPSENNLSPNTKLWLKLIVPVIGTSLILTVMDSLGFRISNVQNWFMILGGSVASIGLLLRQKTQTN